MRRSSPNRVDARAGGPDDRCMDQRQRRGGRRFPPASPRAPVRREDARRAHALVVAHHGASGGNEPPPLRRGRRRPRATRASTSTRDTWLVTDADGAPGALRDRLPRAPGRARSSTSSSTRRSRAGRALALGTSRSARARSIASSTSHATRGSTETIAETRHGARRHAAPRGARRSSASRRARTWWRMSADADAIGAARAARARRHPDRAGRSRDDDDVLRVAHALEEETFAEHYGNVPATFETFRTEYRNGAGYDPTRAGGSRTTTTTGRAGRRC